MLTRRRSSDVERSRGDGLNSRAVRISCWAGTSLSLGGGTIEGGTAPYGASGALCCSGTKYCAALVCGGVGSASGPSPYILSSGRGARRPAGLSFRSSCGLGAITGAAKYGGRSPLGRGCGGGGGGGDSCGRGAACAVCIGDTSCAVFMNGSVGAALVSTAGDGLASAGTGGGGGFAFLSLAEMPWLIPFAGVGSSEGKSSCALGFGGGDGLAWASGDAAAAATSCSLSCAGAVAGAAGGADGGNRSLGIGGRAI